MTFEVLPLLLPEIDVTPDSVSLTVFTGDGPTPVDIRIDNPGTAPLNWTVQTAPDTGAVLWEQVVNGTSGIVSDFFIGSDAGAYSANDFEVSSATTLATIFTPGFDNTNTLAAQPEITWQVYTDDGGVPAGHPEDGTGGASALWTYTAEIGASGVDISNNEITLDLLAAGESLNLAPGTYWLSVFPSYNVTGAGGARWDWYQAAQVGAQTNLVSPDVFGVADWTTLGDLGVTFADTAFRLDEVVECDFDWSAPDTGGGTVDAGGFVELSLVLDETGLPLGVHTGNLCIASDVPGEELVIVPVTLTIEERPITGLTADNDGPVVIGDDVNLSASLAGGTNVTFDWDFGDGNADSGATPNHLYAAPGVYTVTVTASNSVSSEQATTEVQVLGLYTVGGTVSGLEGSGLVLRNNGGDDLTIAGDGGFTFATALADLSSYNVTVAERPSDPIQTCTVSGGAGSLAGEDMTDIAVQCSTEPASLALDISDIDFGAWTSGEQDTRVVILTSSGTGELEIETISAPDAPFGLLGGTCLALPLQLAPGESCEIEVTFTPGEIVTGQFQSSIVIVSNAGSGPDEISLRGVASVPMAIPMLGPIGLIVLALMFGLLAFWQRPGSAT